MGFALGCASRDAPSRPDTGADLDAAAETPEVDAGKVLPAGAKDALTANHTVFCNSYKTCLPAYFANAYGDLDTCVARRLTASVAALFGPGSSLTTEDVVLCGKANGATIACDQILRQFFENPVVPADCRLKGSLPNGSACAGSDQCKSGACRPPVGAVCGVCQDRVALGGTCNAHGDCVEGLGCHRGKCTTFVERGGACDDVSPCHVGDICFASKCEARKKPGAACSQTLQDCDFTSSCHETSNTCTPLELAKLGGSCGQLAGAGYALCEFGLKCKGSTTGACVGAAKLGEACFKSGPTGSQCESPLACAAAICALASTDACR